MLENHDWPRSFCRTNLNGPKARCITEACEVYRKTEREIMVNGMLDRTLGASPDC